MANKKYLETHLLVNKERNKKCKLRVYFSKKEMQDYYKNACPNDENHYRTAGVHHAYYKIKDAEDGTEIVSNETGMVLLCWEQCGAGIVSHEIAHAVLWARSHDVNNTSIESQFPIVIKNMNEEEELLHNLTDAICQFYKWYWKKVDPEFSKYQLNDRSPS